ncbi:hypothetical protein [Sphingobium sp. SA916]|uniref:hypothetical protein n=1 Tax=Sphingobium sp. SA916 TaxID=1851207 RepID=UPI000C9FC0FB|nr:hypothetical protein [Sphingobium sp. SA916]PNQ04028.1 hypothetical protein A8G00_09115 [Sphingobium sp. SA916]
MVYEKGVSIVANWSAILTAAVAVVGYGRYLWGQRQQRRRLEHYLREEKLRDRDESRKGIIHLMGSLSMTEAELLSAAFRSKTVKSCFGVDRQGRADRLLFEYVGEDVPAPTRF